MSKEQIPALCNFKISRFRFQESKEQSVFSEEITHNKLTIQSQSISVSQISAIPSSSLSHLNFEFVPSIKFCIQKSCHWTTTVV